MPLVSSTNNCVPVTAAADLPGSGEAATTTIDSVNSWAPLALARRTQLMDLRHSETTACC